MKLAVASPFTVVRTDSPHWGLAAKACREQILGIPANIGFLYVTEGFGENLSSILTFLRGTTSIRHWVGAVVPGFCGAESSENGVSLMVGMLPEGAFRCFEGADPAASCADLGALSSCFGLLYGNAQTASMAELVASAGKTFGDLAGGLVSSGPQVRSEILSGVAMASAIPVLTGITQGCTPIGRSRVVTAAQDGIVMGLDDRPAVEVLKEDAGDLIARSLKRAAGYIHIGLPTMAGASDTSYMVRELIGIDPRRGWLAVAGRPAVGEPLQFVCRDPNTARAGLARMLEDLSQRCRGRAIRAAFYTASIGHMFGAAGEETAMIDAVLGKIPLIGCLSRGEIFKGRVFGQAAGLSLLLEPGS